jgi:membrane-bound serine protease (ClpP class)
LSPSRIKGIRNRGRNVRRNAIMDPLQIYILTLILGLILVGLELFVPGGVLGVIGGIFLIAAVMLGFQVFGPQGGIIHVIAMVIGVIVYTIVLLKYLPTSIIGRRFTLSRDLKQASAADPALKQLMDQTGTAHTDLRPGGIATIGTERVDVIADGGWISKDAKIRVIDVEGNRVVVQEIAS